MAKITLDVPTIHLNGSSPVQLQDDIRGAATAISYAIDKVSKTAPHMRDFYLRPDGTGRFDAARDQHIARLRTLNRLYAEFVALHDAIENRSNTAELEIGE